MKISTRRRVIAATFAALAISAVTATTANAAAFPVLHGGNGGPAAEVHTCIVLGTDGTTDGVACIDLLARQAVDSTGQNVESETEQVEMYCQNAVTSVVVQCANVAVDHSISNGVGNEISRTNVCGHSNGACSSGRNVWSVGGWDVPEVLPPACTASADQTNQVWAVVYGNNVTSIELPQSDVSVHLNGGNDGSNESTGHYFVCE